MSEEDVNFLISIQDLEQPEFDNACLERENKRLQQENKQLKEEKKKVIEYIKNYDIFKEFSFPLMKRDEENQVKSSIDYQFKKDLKKNILEILGDKE